MLIYKVGEDNVTFTSFQGLHLKCDPSAPIWEASGMLVQNQNHQKCDEKCNFPQKVENIL